MDVLAVFDDCYGSKLSEKLFLFHNRRMSLVYAVSEKRIFFHLYLRMAAKCFPLKGV